MGGYVESLESLESEPRSWKAWKKCPVMGRGWKVNNLLSLENVMPRLTEEQRKILFDEEALRDALRLTSTENVAVILQCYITMSKEEFISVLHSIVKKSY
jgi:hypothetical protein